MESTPYREDPLPSYLENTKSTAYRWQQDMTDSTAHPSVGDNTTRENDIQKDDETARMDRVKQLASLLDDLDASAKSSRIRTSELLHSQTSSPPDSPIQREYTTSQQSTIPSQPLPRNKRDRRDLSDIHEHRSEDDSELLSDLDEMINNIPSDEEPDPHFSPAAQSTPRNPTSQKSKSLARELFTRSNNNPVDDDDDGDVEEVGVTPVRGLKSAQRTPAANKTPGKTVDFKDTSTTLPRHPSKPPKTPAGYVAPSPIERRPSSPRKFSGQSNSDTQQQKQRQPSPLTPTPVDPALKHLSSQLQQMQEEIRKRDSMIQDLYKQFQSPPSHDVAAELAKAKAEIQELKHSTTELKRGQESLVAMSAEDRHSERGSQIHRNVKERVGKWQEFLETPISVSRRSRQTPRQSRILDEEEEILPPVTRFVPKLSSPKPHASPKQDLRERQTDKDDNEVERLREALAKAQSQIAQLKVEKAAGKGPEDGHEMHARPLGPSMMPDAKNAKLAREEKIYYRLGLYKIDRLCSNETANLLKNVLIQLDVPLDQLIYEITHLSQKMREHSRLREFAMGVHEKIYGGERMETDGAEGDIDVECLREMLDRVGKLATRKR